ncbi:MAG: Gfo/Idh/MocA family oxidoreductase [Planctomycetota bacterium]|nr:MAG: Gfo/Idh/MocA family oxidoreductase [Planctomycetota bacterium]
MSTINRRTFHGSVASAGALAALHASGASVLGSNERVQIGMIGVGNRGDQLLDALLCHKDAEIIGLCDVYEPYLAAAHKKVGGRARLHHDFRELLDRKDIDAVAIATPDHWHALQFVAACRAGKDVYVEKPLSLTIGEGQKMVAVAEETKRVTQVGLHRRSSPPIREAVEFIRTGGIGKVTVAQCYHLRNESPMGIGKPADCEPPPGLDWDLWLGPAAKVAYNPNRCLYKFRWFSDYSGGQLTNFGTHYLDVIQWALGKDAPRGVFAAGGKYVLDDNRDIPDTMEVVWDYGETLVTMSQFNANASPPNQRGWELEFRGTLGTVLMQEGQVGIVPEKVRTRELPALSPTARKENTEQARATRTALAARTFKGNADTAQHTRDFLDAVKSRGPTHCPVPVGHRSTSATLLAKIALRRGRYLEWDPKSERIVNDVDANRLLSYEYRQPWRLT